MHVCGFKMHRMHYCIIIVSGEGVGIINHIINFCNTTIIIIPPELWSTWCTHDKPIMVLF